MKARQVVEYREPHPRATRQPEKSIYPLSPLSSIYHHRFVLKRGNTHPHTHAMHAHTVYIYIYTVFQDLHTPFLMACEPTGLPKRITVIWKGTTRGLPSLASYLA